MTHIIKNKIHCYILILQSFYPRTRQMFHKNVEEYFNCLIFIFTFVNDRYPVNISVF